VIRTVVSKQTVHFAHNRRRDGRLTAGSSLRAKGTPYFLVKGLITHFFYLLDEIIFAFEQHFYGFTVKA
jgi:hypothetical protein